ncbi:MAG: ABC transporter ATP-binding protein [Candidatus Omnitrophota bacterium]
MFRMENICCGYGSKIVINNISLEVEKGELVGIIGPNGSGKTTLLRAMTRVLKLRGGNIFLNEKNIRSMNIKEISRQIAVVSQNAPTNFMTAEEFIFLGRMPHFKSFHFFETKRDKEIVEESMALTGTLEFRDRFLHELSGGERQLIVVARALAQEPRILMLDEPTAYLDITHQIKILDLIKKLNSQLRITVIMVLHDLNLASEYCHKLVLINKGRVHEMGRPEEVLKYRTIEEVYKTLVVVRENPISGKPCVFLVSEEERIAHEKKRAD